MVVGKGKKEKDWHPLFDMKIHDVINLTHCHNVTVLKVVGGWIYYNREHEVKDHVIVDTMLSHGVFVPYGYIHEGE